VLVRSGQEPMVVNLDIPMVEQPEAVHWVDNIHPAPKPWQDTGDEIQVTRRG
jgi:hypothetical protein